VSLTLVDGIFLVEHVGYVLLGSGRNGSDGEGAISGAALIFVGEV
jgi:hypothetical protein